MIFCGAADLHAFKIIGVSFEGRDDYTAGPGSPRVIADVFKPFVENTKVFRILG